MKKILLISDSNFFNKNFKLYLKKKKLKFKILIVNHIKIKKYNLKNSEIYFTVVNLGMSGGINFNIKNGCKILNYNTERYLKILSLLKERKIKNLFFISASCVYPKNLNSLKEKDFGKGEIEKTSYHYAASKIIGSLFCSSVSNKKNYNWQSIIPATLYGKYNNDKKNSHVISSFFEKFKKKNGVIKLWGSGKPKREFLHIQDFIEALFFIKEKKIHRNVINVGYGEDISIKKLADIFQTKSKFRGEVKWDKTKPDGAKKKLLDSSFIFSKGWRPKINLIKGITDILD
ncbi:NAD-dependent epimerase/dehydratase family protein [Candidatus Pelagibacter sp.]|nr:NAD-dependent epimerase/dehydratase family protein [Candidatus Pelagibacter sp.]